MKKSKIPLLIIPLAFLGMFFWWRWANGAISSEEKSPQNFSIRKGETLDSIAQRLQEEKLIRNSLAFKIIVYYRHLTSSIQAGSYNLSPSLTAQELALNLTHGTADIWLTFPEGWRREEIGQRLAANLEGFNQAEFLNLSQDLEGYLFPDTYLIPKTASPAQMIEILQKNFEKKTKTLLEENSNPDLSLNEILILASLVEREARNEVDRPIVAGILLKRWQNNWPLQVDATIQYFKGNATDWWPEVTKKDLTLDSPFNTYKYKGLPPSPICNPGLGALKAVIRAQASDYWFYLSDNQGKIHFAQTAEEHQQNITRYLQ